MSARVSPFGDLDDFQPRSPASRTDDGIIDKIAEASNFPSRAPRAERVEVVPEQGAAEVPAASSIRSQRRYRTGRNQQLNIKASKETVDQFYALADAFGEPLGVVFERAVKALRDERRDGSKPR
jgi:hypothetical protein